MGTYWNEGCYALDLGSLLCASPTTTSRNPLKFRNLVEVTDQPQPTKNVYAGDSRSQQVTITEIPKIRVSAEDVFEKILRAGKPVVIEGSNLGTCVNKWTGEYLTENVGSQRKVSLAANTNTFLADQNVLGCCPRSFQFNNGFQF